MESSNAIYEKILHSPGYPQLPPEHIQLLHDLFENTSLSMNDLQSLIESHPEFSASIIRAVNSPVFNPEHPVDNVKSAILLLGAESISNIALQRLLLNYFPPRRLPGQHFDIAIFWHHLVAVGLAADKIGIMTGHEDPFRLFTYGLLHDIGVIVIDACLPDMMDEIESKVVSGLGSYAAEKLVLSGLSHTNIGEWVSRQWGIGDIIANIARYHHTPAESPSPSRDLDIISISEIMGDRYYANLLGVKTLILPYNMEIVDKLGLSTAQLSDLEELLPKLVDEFLDPFDANMEVGTLLVEPVEP